MLSFVASNSSTNSGTASGPKSTISLSVRNHDSLDCANRRPDLPAGRSKRPTCVPARLRVLVDVSALCLRSAAAARNIMKPIAVKWLFQIHVLRLNLLAAMTDRPFGTIRCRFDISKLWAPASRRSKIVKQVRWGIIGCGNVTELKSGPAFQLVQAAGSWLLCVATRQLPKTIARRHDVEKWYDDAEQLILDPDVDAVYIATPPGSHHHYGLRVCERGNRPTSRNRSLAIIPKVVSL